MEPRRRWGLDVCPCIWFGFGYDHIWGDIAIYLPFVHIWFNIKGY
jgi:hypothetical protein